MSGVEQSSARSFISSHVVIVEPCLITHATDWPVEHHRRSDLSWACLWTRTRGQRCGRHCLEPPARRLHWSELFFWHGIRHTRWKSNCPIKSTSKVPKRSIRWKTILGICTPAFFFFRTERSISFLPNFGKLGGGLSWMDWHFPVLYKPCCHQECRRRSSTFYWSTDWSVRPNWIESVPFHTKLKVVVTNGMALFLRKCKSNLLNFKWFIGRLLR